MSIRHYACFVAAALGLSAISCGFFEDAAEQDVTFTVDVPAEFTIDGDQICQSAGSFDCSSDNYQPSPMRQELPEIEFSQDVDIRDHTDRDIEQYTGNFETITIEEIENKVENNTLSFNIPETELHLGPYGTEDSSADDAFLLTTLDTVPAMQNIEKTAQVSESAQQQASPLFKELRFSIIPRFSPVIEEGQDIPPHGQADMTLTFQIKFVAQPL